MSIQFKDFFPKVKKQGWFNKEFATLEETLEQVNTWINQNNVQVFNVETVILPNVEKNDGQTTQVKIRTSGEMSSYWYQVIRVWYRS